MNKILLFTLLAAVIIVGTLQLGNLTFAQTPPPIKEKIIRPVDVGPTDLCGYSSSISSSKVDAVTDNPPTPSTTYITSNVNNQGQNFKYFHGLDAGTQIVEVVEQWKGYKTNPSGTTKVRSFVQVGSTSYNDLKDFPLPLFPTIGTFSKTYPKDPTNNQNWTKERFDTAAIGWKQATATKPSFITDASIKLRVSDFSPPRISGMPANIVIEATSDAGAVVNFALPTYWIDDVDGPVPVECTYSSGSAFPIGETTVTCSATDLISLNRAESSFTVDVIDMILNSAYAIGDSDTFTIIDKQITTPSIIARI